MRQSLGRRSLGQLDFVTGFETTALAGCHLAALPLHQSAAYAPLAEYSCITAAVRRRDLVFQSISFRAEVVTGQKSTPTNCAWHCSRMFTATHVFCLVTYCDRHHNRKLPANGYCEKVRQDKSGAKVALTTCIGPILIADAVSGGCAHRRLTDRMSITQAPQVELTETAALLIHHDQRR
jgi:hypothetical protein